MFQMQQVKTVAWTMHVAKGLCREQTPVHAALPRVFGPRVYPWLAFR